VVSQLPSLPQGSLNVRVLGVPLVQYPVDVRRINAAFAQKVHEAIGDVCIAQDPLQAMRWTVSPEKSRGRANWRQAMMSSRSSSG
jgi:hypothetical protein